MASIVLRTPIFNWADDTSSYTLFRLYPTEELQLDAIKLFDDPGNSIEVLKKSRGLNDSTDILVPPDGLAYVERTAKENQLNYEVKNNYGRWVIPYNV